MSTLITGVGGFAGRHLVDALTADGTEPIGLGRSAEPGDSLRELLRDYLRVDLRDADATRAAVAAARPELVFHLAADASVARSWSAPADTLRNNLDSTLNLLEAVRHDAPRARVLIAGSGEQYGVPESLPVTEDVPLRPQNPYAVSKSSADLLAGFYADAHGLHLVRTRAFNHAGPGQSDTYVVASFARQIAEAERDGREELDLVTGNIEVRRDFSDVRDVVHAYRLALERAEPGAYNVCSGESTRVADILAGLANLTSLRVAQQTDPKLVREHEVMEIRGSNEKLSAATGWRPERLLETTLRDTLDWWRKRPAA